MAIKNPGTILILVGAPTLHFKTFNRGSLSTEARIFNLVGQQFEKLIILTFGRKNFV